MIKAIAVTALFLFSGGTALAQRVGPTKPGKVVSKTHQPVGTPHKVSSFAPHKTNKRVFGDPIQAPIVHSQPAPKPK